MTRTIGLLLLIIFPAIIYAQDNASVNQPDFEQIIQDLLPTEEESMDYQDLYDHMLALYTDPLNLNNVSRENLQSLYMLSEVQINNLLSYRAIYGDFITIYELMSIDGFDRHTIETILPFVCIRSRKDEKTFSSYFRNPDHNDLFLRYQLTPEMKKGYASVDSLNSKSASGYSGGPAKIFTRYRYSKTNRYSFGFTTEKDPGESFVWDSKTGKYGFDYYSIHLMVENIGVLKKIVIGDYNLSFGQGLVFGSGLVIGKGSEPVTTARKTNYGLRVSRSAVENKDYSGIAFTVSAGSFDITSFYSLVKRDGILHHDSLSGYGDFVLNLQESGLHRTPSEMSSRRTVLDRSVGFNILHKLKDRDLEIGISMVSSHFSQRILPAQDDYTQFDFSGDLNYTGSIYGNYYLGNTHFFGELAQSRSGGKACLTGLITSLTSNVQLAILYRNYDKDFHSLLGNAWKENTNIANERGAYWGVKLNPFKNIILNMYMDIFSFPWLKYRVNSPSEGYSFSGSLVYNPFNRVKLSFRYQEKKKSLNTTVTNDPLSKPNSYVKRNYYIVMDYKAHRIINMGSKIQWSDLDNVEGETFGFLLSQNISFNLKKFNLTSSFAVFNTDNYDTRQYIYEKDLLYFFNIPSFSNRGVRYSVISSYNWSNRITFWFKYASTRYPDQEVVGSGMEEIQGNKKSYIGLQMRLRL